MQHSIASVCMAVYNGEKYLRKQLESVLSELRDDDELIICDDNSDDSTSEIINEYIKDSRIKYFKNVESLGVIKNFEKALLKAKGDYIFLCDQDDIWLKGKLNACISNLKNNMLVVTDCILVNQNLQTIETSFFKLRNSGKGFLKNIWKNTYLGCCMAFRKDLLKYSMPMPNNIPMHDMWLGLQAELHGNVLFLNEKLSLYRRHNSAISPTGSKSDFGIKKKVEIRVTLCWYLMLRAIKNKFYKYEA